MRKTSQDEGTPEDFQRGRDDYKAGRTFDVYEVAQWQEGWQYQFDIETEDCRAPRP